MTATSPQMCKISKVIPVYKGGDFVYDKYRPISLLPFLSKILEKKWRHAGWETLRNY